MGGLAMIDLYPDDEVSVCLGGSEENGVINGRLVTNHGGGVLRVTESPSFSGDISLGTYAGRAGNLGLATPGILRGFIQQECFAVVDTAGKAFFNKESENLYLPDTYTSLSVNDVRFF